MHTDAMLTAPKMGIETHQRSSRLGDAPFHVAGVWVFWVCLDGVVAKVIASSLSGPVRTLMR